MHAAFPRQVSRAFFGAPPSQFTAPNPFHVLAPNSRHLQRLELVEAAALLDERRVPARNEVDSRERRLYDADRDRSGALCAERALTGHGCADRVFAGPPCSCVYCARHVWSACGAQIAVLKHVVLCPCL
eukprot:1785081-Pleurochrysis_carterae.AAC.1